MSLQPGSPWGCSGAVPADAPLVATDAELATLASGAQPPTVVALVGGDLCRTLGGRGTAADTRGGVAVLLPVDVWDVRYDEKSIAMVAHMVAHRSLWRGECVFAMNADFFRAWNVAPRAHPGDGRLDIVRARLGLRQGLQARRRLPTGTHLPHPKISTSRTAAAVIELEQPTPLFVDGRRVGVAERVELALRPTPQLVVV